MSAPDYQITLIRPTVTKQEGGTLIRYGEPVAHLTWQQAEDRLTAMLGKRDFAGRVLHCIFDPGETDESA